MEKIKIKFKTPISYYGGKQKLAAQILCRIPSHLLYCEPFVGGAAVFFAKEPSEIEVLNDTNKELINFYRVLQNNYVELEKMIGTTLHSRSLYQDALTIYNNPHLFSATQRAWAVWVQSMQAFASKLNNSWGFDKSRNIITKKNLNNRERFTTDYAVRLQNVQLENADALYLIRSRDTAQSFFYCDPPYINSNCGHYEGYREEDFIKLLKVLTHIKGKFLLSSYPSKSLLEYSKQNGWQSISFERGLYVTAKLGYQKKNIEVLTSNYAM